MITRLDGATSRKISAGQVITDLTSVVKELLENALDAQAKTAKIRIANYGLDEITVEDDGTGIPMGPLVDVELGQLRPGATTPLLSSRASTKHREDESSSTINALHTPSALQPSTSTTAVKVVSKDGNGDGEDASDPSLGFRGEALHSLAHVSHLTVETRTTETGPFTVRITYDAETHTSHLAVVQLREACGTTVTARRLFEQLPVRHREYKKNARKQLTKATSILKQYAVSHPHIRLLMVHQETPASAPVTLVSLTGSGDASRSVTEAYGGLCVSHMQRVEWTLSFGTLTGYVSKVDGGGRLSSDHQVFALDGRLVDLPRLGKAINDAFTQCLPNASQRLHVGFFLQIKTNASLQYDVNLTPNKRKVLLTQEERLADEVYHCALQEFSLASQSIELNRDQRMAQRKAADMRANDMTKLTRTPVSATAFTQFTFKRPKGEEELPASDEVGGQSVMQGQTAGAQRAGPLLMDLPKLGSFLYGGAASISDADDGNGSSANELLLPSSSSSAPCSAVDLDGKAAADDGGSASEASDGDEAFGEGTAERGDNDERAAAQANEACLADEAAVEVTRLSDEGCRQRCCGPCHYCIYPTLTELAREDLCFDSGSGGGLAGDAPTATAGHFGGAQKRERGPKAAARTLGAQTESDLNSYFNKTSFKDMRVVGQFNHGFIIAVLQNGDVFVVDQHASDEKYNYERLMRDYVATPQPLVMPVPVAMDTHEVDLAVAHKDALQQHGFKVQRGADDTKLLVCSLPVLPYDVVNASDVMELIQQLVQYGSITNPLRAVWHSMATKACRSSIMIGTALTMKKMKQILERLGELDQPWNCPHGRPTLRLLGNMADLRREDGVISL